MISARYAYAAQITSPHTMTLATHPIQTAGLLRRSVT